ncbi:NUDIX domain-containing protein [Flavobacterium franklandianum]|uniref:NUDIX domain-containing protein n=1 Tax=Flavobacterium franklandianum TaxID=2594430 RepID=A0A553CNP3_9FLAO|nr:NUDIX domain-containing protein [Flavobacterium franklandianum]TRX22213.1 NUDIX domain-containing protein [Flavobacterium franklandianum]TRX28941.1 NUDIX domain-containing protein [Flavobacterium franklandianum]
MEFRKLIEENSNEAWVKYLPNLSIDCVVFGFHDAVLKVLLIKIKEEKLWGLPGGYVLKTENLNEAASRILLERTGAANIYLQQFRVFSDLNRSEGFFENFDDAIWNKQRFLSIGFYALVDYSQVNLIVDEISDACEWTAIDELPKLMMDHGTIFEKALVALRKQLNYKPIGYNLLPEKFTMPELQKLYEIILGKKLNRGNFYRKMLRYDILIKLNEIRKGGAHKAPDLYQFDIEKYHLALKNGFNEGW